MARSPRGNKSKDKSFRRKVATRSPRRTVLVFCEGARTEVDYLKALKSEPAVREVASVDIQIDEDTHGYAPLTLVTAAAEARERANGEDGEIDEVWCIFDVEQPQNHPNLKKAVALARDRSVQVAVSNPCFELWLALHFQDQTAPIASKAADGLRRTLDGSQNKGVDGYKYMSRCDEAARRARSLTTKHKRDGTKFPNDNPSSGMYRLLEAVERPTEDST